MMKKDFFTLQNAKKIKETCNIIGLDTTLFPIYKALETIASCDVNILITGETGTGKEVIADLIHRLSPRKNGPLIKINCAALPDSLLESELFGFTKGAFTGAIENRKGKIEHAHTGSLFLDEIGEIKMELQAKLLRVLQTKEFSPIGSSKNYKADFRLIAATNVNLEEAVKNNNFREDLYYRLTSFPIKLPSLKERKEDIPDFLEFLLRKISLETKLKVKAFSPEALDILNDYSWPGNIREMENLILQALILSPDEKIIDDATIKKLISPVYDKQYNQAIQEIMLRMINVPLDLKDINKDIIHALLKHFNNDVKLIEAKTGLSKDKIYRYKRR